MLDSHCHLTSRQLVADFEGVLCRACEAGVTQILNVGDNIESSRLAAAQADKAAQYGIEMWASAGVHPQNATEYSCESSASQIREIARHPRVCAIGEIGLDFVYDETHLQYPGATRQVQERVLRAQLDLAMELNLPVIIHNREADDALVGIMREYSTRLTGVFHCFGSPPEIARQLLDLGFYLGFTGLVTFKNAPVVREVARICPLDRLLIETDAPYLAPVPFRGKTNEPSYLPAIAAIIATLHAKTVVEIETITTANSTRLFQLSTNVD